MKKIGEPIEEKELNNVSGGAFLANNVAGQIVQDEINGLINGAKQSAEEKKDSLVNGIKNIFS